MLICLEKFQGTVIFATNLVTNYDPAFETRVRHLHFPMPDAQARAAIWRKHLPSTLPVASDLDVTALAEAEEHFCGRDIKNAVIHAALQAARHGQSCLTQHGLLDAIQRIVAARDALHATGAPVDRIRQAVQAVDGQTPDTERTPELVGAG